MENRSGYHTWLSLEKDLKIQRQAENNKVTTKVEALFEITAHHVVPLFLEELRVHGIEVTKDDCLAHLELNFKFDLLSKMVDGFLG